MTRSIISIIRYANSESYKKYGKNKLYNRNRIQFVLQKIAEEYETKTETIAEESKKTKTIAEESETKTIAEESKKTKDES
jgi:hypothetical protein